MSDVAIVGAAGFLGRALLKQLARNGVRASAIVRGTPEILADLGHDVIRATDVTTGRFPTVVNLAYPTAGAPYTYPSQNAALFKLLDGLVEDGGRLVHVSSQAVFGATLDRPIQPGPVEQRREDPYVEAKLAAERHVTLMHRRRGLSVDIVRPGNIAGKGSGAWGAPLVHRLLTGRAVGVKGVDGYSNTTDVANAASYLAHLLERPGTGLRFHHLAEFSGHRWSEWINPTADLLGVVPTFVDRADLRPEAAPGARSMLRSVYRPLALGRVSGSWTRTGLRMLPDRVRGTVKGLDLVEAPRSLLSHDERVYISVLATDVEFRSVVDDAWTPPLRFDQSLEAFLAWVRAPSLEPIA